MSEALKLISRKQLSALMTKRLGEDITVDQIRKNEIAWGLVYPIRRHRNARVVRYDEAKSIEVLKKKGIL